MDMLSEKDDWRSFKLGPTPTSKIKHVPTEVLLTRSLFEEHILRSISNGSAPQARARNRSSSIITNPYDGYEKPPTDDFMFRAKNRMMQPSKYSPTPSIKRGKAERLLKEHGSPPGVRVTAGGRIVPDGLSPLTSPRFTCPTVNNRYQSSNASAYRFSNEPMNGLVAHDANGNLVQVVNGEVRPIEVVNGYLRLHVPASNVGTHTQPALTGSTTIPPQAYPIQNEATRRECRILEAVHANLERELKELDRSEVLQRDALTPQMREAIVKKRRELVDRMDEHRIAMRRLNDITNVHGGVGLSRPTTAYLHSHSEPMTQVPFAYGAINGQHASWSAPLDSTLPYQQTHQDILAPQIQAHMGNSGLGIYFGAVNSKDVDNTITAQEQIKSEGGMNLDGTAHQPRRSHAIEIKKPNAFSAHGKPSLNPESPEYQPANVATSISEYRHGQTDEIAFIASPRLEAEISNLVQSPGQGSRNLDTSPNQHPSASSASTTDFFPLNTYQYSSRKHSPDVEHAKAAWLQNNNLSMASKSHVTPARLRNTLVWNDNPDSPDERCYVNPPNTQVHTRNASEQESPYDTHQYDAGRMLDHGNHTNCDMDFITHASFPQISPATQRQQSAVIQDTSGSTSLSPLGLAHLGQNSFGCSSTNETGTFGAANEPGESLSKTDAYLAGYEMGSKLAVLPENKDEEYRRGYRDGLVHATATAAAGVSHVHAFSAQTVSTPPFRRTTDFHTHIRQASITKTSSLPSISVPQISSNIFPSSPAQYGNTGATESPLHTSFTDATESGFMSQPNVNLNTPIRDASVEMTATAARGRFGAENGNRVLSDPQISFVHGREIGTQTSGQEHRVVEPLSPLANRRSPNASFNNHGARSASFATRMQNRNHYDDQRYAKASPSVAPSAEHARRSFPQYDGSADDDKPLARKSTGSAPNSPSGKAITSRVKAPGSPVKVASAAVAKMGQLAGLTKTENRSVGDGLVDPATLPSPEKAKWRLKWKKNFEKLRAEEQDEIKQYKRDHPIK